MNKNDSKSDQNTSNNPENDPSFKLFPKTQLMAIIENTEENSLKLEKLSTQKSKELQEILAAKSPMENYQNVAEYLNENIVNEKAKTLNFLQINISSKTTHSENQNGNYKNSATNISDSRDLHRNENDTQEGEKPSNGLIQLSQRSSVGNGTIDGKNLTETSNDNFPAGSSLKKKKSFGFQEVSSEISDLSFQLRKRIESKSAHVSPMLIRNDKEEENKKEEANDELNLNLQNLEDDQNFDYPIDTMKERGNRSPAQIKWRKISNVVTSLRLMQKSEVSQLLTVDHLEKEVFSIDTTIKQHAKTVHEPDTKPSVLSQYKKNSVKPDVIKDTFNEINRDQDFSDCCTRGKPEDINKIKFFLQNDPKKYILERSDPLHLINKLNINGLNPLYLAAMNGNLNVVKFLIENQANPLVNSKLGDKILESPLEVASSESIIIIGTFKDIWKISFKEKKPSMNHFKTLGSNYPNNYFTCLEAWKIKNDNFLIVNIHEKGEKKDKNEKIDKKVRKENKNYIEIFNIDKNTTIIISNLEKININPYMMKHIYVFDENFLFCYCENPLTMTTQTYLIHIKFDKLDNTKVVFNVEDFELSNQAFILDMDYIIHDNKIIFAFANIDGDLEIIAFNLLPVEKLDKIFKSENLIIRCDKRFEFPISNLKLFFDEDINSLCLYITSSLGFVFSFKNILEKKFSDGQMQINDNTKECITHFELEKYEGKKVMFLVTYDGVVSVYSQEHETKWQLVYSEPITSVNLKAFICSRAEDKFIVYISGNLVDIYYVDKFFIN